jgi:tetratricopeptide (TPR) repeat protein
MTRLFKPTYWLLTAFLTCFGVGIATPALAAGSITRKAAAKIEVQKAQVQYKLGRFDEALEAYSRAYEMFNAPALLFNIGQCHKNLKDYDRAIFFFEGYLREETHPNPRTQTLARELIAESRAALEERRRAEAEAQASASATKRPSTSSVAAAFGAPPNPPFGSPLLVDASTQPQATTPLTHRWWFWTALGVGTIAIAGGALAYLGSGQTSALPTGTLGTLDRR